MQCTGWNIIYRPLIGHKSNLQPAELGLSNAMVSLIQNQNFRRQWQKTKLHKIKPKLKTKHKKRANWIEKQQKEKGTGEKKTWLKKLKLLKRNLNSMRIKFEVVESSVAKNHCLYFLRSHLWLNTFKIVLISAIIVIMFIYSGVVVIWHPCILICCPPVSFMPSASHWACQITLSGRKSKFGSLKWQRRPRNEHYCYNWSKNILNVDIVTQVAHRVVRL